MSRRGASQQGVRGVTRAAFIERSALTVASLSMSSLLVACGGTSSTTGSSTAAAGVPPARPVGTFRFPLEKAPTILDIAFGSELSDYIVQRSIFDRLVAFNEANTELVPAIATRWEQSDDAREFVFTLREGLTFHDGEPVDSTAVKRSLQYFLGATGSVAALLSPPRYAVLDDSDPLRLRIALPVASPDFVNNQTFLGVISPKSIARGADAMRTKPVGSGAYRFVGRNGAGTVTVAAFDEFWGDGPYFEQIEFRVVEDPGARINALRAGQADIVYRVPPTQLPRVEGAPDVKTVSGRPVWSATYVAVACNVAPFDDVRVRQACAHAIDKAALVKAIARDQAVPLDTFSPRGLIGWAPPAVTYAYDPERARQLLAAAGHPDGIKVRAAIPSNGAYLQPELGQAVFGQLREAGIDVEVDVRDQVAQVRSLLDPEQREYGLFTAELTWLTGTPLNQVVGCIDLFGRYSEPDVDVPLRRMRTTPDGPAREQAFAAYEAAVSRKVPIIPLFQSIYTDALAEGVGGYTVTPKNGFGPNVYPMFGVAGS